MRAHLQRSDFSLTELRKQVCSVYVVLDFADMAPEKQGRYMRVLLSMAMDRARKTPLPADRNNRRTLFILDEVGMLGKMPTIERNYKILRGAHVKLWSFFQEYKTMTQIFDNSEALMSASTKQFFGVNDPTTAEEVTKFLGKYLDIRRSGSGSGEGKYEQSKALLDESDVTDALKQKSMTQIVLTGGGAKFMLRRVACFPSKTAQSVPNPVQASHTAPVTAPPPQQQQRPQTPPRPKQPSPPRQPVQPKTQARASPQQQAPRRTSMNTSSGQHPPADVTQALALFGLPQDATIDDVNKRMKLLENKAKHSKDYEKQVKFAHTVLLASQRQ